MLKTFIAIPALCMALNVSASCPAQRPGDLPMIPDGASATQSEMRRAQLLAENFMLQAETYLECGVMSRQQQNALLLRLEKLDELYKEELIKYQMRANMIAFN